MPGQPLAMPLKKKADPRLKNTLMTLITLMKHKAEDQGLDPVITVAKLTDMLKMGGTSVSYQQLVDLTQDPAIKKSIKSINKNQIVLNLGDDAEEPAPNVDFSAPPTPGPEAAPEGESDEEWNADELEIPDETEDVNEPEYPDQTERKPNVVSQMAKRAASRS